VVASFVVVGTILVDITVVASADVARVNTSFRKHFEVLVRNHGLERKATDEYN
jgi:hypothetical protein